MFKYAKSISIYMTLVLLAPTVFADQTGQQDRRPSMMNGSSDYDQHKKDYIGANCPVGPLPNKDYSIVLDGTFLWWTASSYQTSPATTWEVISQGVETDAEATYPVPINRGKFKQEWDPGFRLSLGAVTGYDG
jgi:hypothetical protein